MNVPTLYFAPGACSLSVHIVLEWIGKPNEAIKGDPSSPDYRSINPAGAVPALRLESGTVLTQCEAILNYLGRIHPESDLLDDGSDESRAELDRWGNFLTGDLHPAFFPVFMPHRYTTSTDADALKAVRDAALDLASKKIGLLDEHLVGREWMTGDKRTILDAYSVPMVN